MLPTMVFDYVYAVLHSPSYRKKYKEFLKIDFPRVPYPASAAEFERLAAIGGRLRRLHLMQEVPPLKYALFNTPGTCVVDCLRWEPQPVVGNASERCHDEAKQRSEALPTLGSVWINKEQRFENVPEAAWTFYIGGYQPAQKWLNDRRGRTLTYDDVAHYQQIIAVLMETGKLMNEIVRIL